MSPVHRRMSRRRGAAAIAVLGLVALGGCGSDDDGDAATSGTGAFCEAVADYAEAVRTGDQTAVAGALEGSTDDLPEDAARTVDAYVDALTAAPPNQSADTDDVEERTAEASFRAYATEACGADALPAVDATSTSTPDTTTTTVAGSTDPSPDTTGPGNSANETDEGDDQGDDTGPADESESYPYDTTEPEAG